MRIEAIKVSAIALLLVTALGATGCKAGECERMMECCTAVEELDGVGNACGDIAKRTRDPDTCRTVLRTTEMMFEDRKKELPRACRPR